MKIRPRLFAAAISLFLGTSVASTPAAAQGQTAPAVDDFASARALFNAGKVAEALPLFRDVYARSSSPNARLYVARCLRKLGRNPEAYDEMEATLREATKRAETEPKYAQTRDSAAAELALLEPLVGKLIIAVADPRPGMKKRSSPTGCASSGTPGSSQRGCRAGPGSIGTGNTSPNL